MSKLHKLKPFLYLIGNQFNLAMFQQIKFPQGEDRAQALKSLKELLLIKGQGMNHCAGVAKFCKYQVFQILSLTWKGPRKFHGKMITVT